MHVNIRLMTDCDRVGEIGYGNQPGASSKALSLDAVSTVNSVTGSPLNSADFSKNISNATG